MTSWTEPVKCAHPRCRQSYAPHAHAAIQAHKDGWFQQKNGDNWCPKHVPLWVAEWRAKKMEDKIVCVCGHKLYEHGDKGHDCEKTGCTCPVFRTS